MSKSLAPIVALVWLFGGVAAAMPSPEPELEADQAVALLASRPYTNHRAGAVRTEIITLRVDYKFDASEQFKLLRAIEEWNYVLNGHIRFDVDPVSLGAAAQQATVTTRNPNTWTISHGEGQAQRRGSADVAAATLALPSGGGVMILFDDAIGHADLGNIVMHELGHVLGLQHDRTSRLMSVNYLGDRQGCIDEATVRTLAALRGLPIDELNWCSLPAVASEAEPSGSFSPAP